ncbi:hypothetical protein JW707_04180 [Candidatus Woesearchaeota archaeon]|nr:hypothetical protein [Candidatus Woesearchaeota archaeon]
MVSRQIFDEFKRMNQQKADECPENGGSEQFAHPDFPGIVMCRLTIDYDCPRAPRKNPVDITCPHLGNEDMRISPDDPATKIYYCPCYLPKK